MMRGFSPDRFSTIFSGNEPFVSTLGTGSVADRGFSPLRRRKTFEQAPHTSGVPGKKPFPTAEARAEATEAIKSTQFIPA
jgi:hypothetical protein